MGEETFSPIRNAGLTNINAVSLGWLFGFD